MELGVDDEAEPLPKPDSEQLDELGVTGTHAVIYGLLYRRRCSTPPTMTEIREHVERQQGPLSQTDRRLRDLRAHFEIPARVHSGEHRYTLIGWRDQRTDNVQVSGRVRAEVLAPQRCAMCGKTPLEDGVKLVVDHKVPREWGGGNELENLQPLCEECNGGKQNRFGSFSAYGGKIRQAVGYQEPHRRIGELLKAFGGEWVSGELIEIVASAIQYQEDWQKRARELRTLGWTLETEKRHDEGPRVRTYYRVTHWEPWPGGSISGEVRRIEKEQRAARRNSSS